MPQRQCSLNELSEKKTRLIRRIRFGSRFANLRNGSLKLVSGWSTLERRLLLSGNRTLESSASSFCICYFQSELLALFACRTGKRGVC